MNQQHMHPLTLRFADAKTENNYQSYDFPRIVTQGRYAIVIGMLTYTMLGVLFDHALFSADVWARVWSIRLTALMVPTLVLALSFHPLFRRFNYLPLALVGMAAGIGIILMSMQMTLEMSAYYYPCLIVVAFFTYNFIGTSFVYALAVDFSLLLAYNLAIGWRGDFPPMTLAVHDFYIVMANLIGGGAGYLTELQRRRLFLADIHLREEIEAAQAARQEADLANTAKSRFLAAVSHDLRQPAHAQGLFLNVLAHTNLDTKQQHIVANMRAAITATSEMLHTLMDFARIEAGAVKPNMRAFRLQPLLNKIEAEFMPQADAKGLTYRSRETALIALSDQSLVEIILRNLVSNAIRYTNHGGILIACRKRGETVMLEVYDTGIGIEASQHRIIFREFHQLGNPERDRRKGLGLGLSIVDGLMRTLGHPLSLNSTPNRGSLFRLALPLANAAEVEPESHAKPSAPRKTGIRILLVDDDETVRMSTAQQLLEWGFECDAAESIEDALALAQAHPPHLVISDYRLRDHQTGAEVVTALRKTINPLLPAILITGDTAPERIKEAYTKGIPLLHKPVAPNNLYHHIVEALEPN